LAESGELARHIAIDAGFVRDDLDLFVSGRIIELDRDETLARRMLQVFLDALIPRVIRNHEQKADVRFDRLATLFDRQDAPMVRQWVDEDSGVLARLDDFVEVTNRAAPDRLRQRAVHPYGF